MVPSCIPDERGMFASREACEQSPCMVGLPSQLVRHIGGFLTREGEAPTTLATISHATHRGYAPALEEMRNARNLERLLWTLDPRDLEDAIDMINQRRGRLAADFVFQFATLQNDEEIARRLLQALSQSQWTVSPAHKLNELCRAAGDPSTIGAFAVALDLGYADDDATTGNLVYCTVVGELSTEQLERVLRQLAAHGIGLASEGAAAAYEVSQSTMTSIPPDTAVAIRSLLERLQFYNPRNPVQPWHLVLNVPLAEVDPIRERMSVLLTAVTNSLAFVLTGSSISLLPSRVVFDHVLTGCVPGPESQVPASESEFDAAPSVDAFVLPVPPMISNHFPELAQQPPPHWWMEFQKQEWRFSVEMEIAPGRTQEYNVTYQPGDYRIDLDSKCLILSLDYRMMPTTARRQPERFTPPHL